MSKKAEEEHLRKRREREREYEREGESGEKKGSEKEGIKIQWVGGGKRVAKIKFPCLTQTTEEKRCNKINKILKVSPTPRHKFKSGH